MNLLAIDPGANGGWALSSENGPACGNLPQSDGDTLELLRSLDPGECFLEDLVKYTGVNMPSSAMATYAGNWGFLRGALMALGWRVVLVRPQEWQKALGLGTSRGVNKTEWKNKLKQRASELFPMCKVTLATSDALLILEFAKRRSWG
jgi:hypothetical protein